jgi:hypothetical protein
LFPDERRPSRRKLIAFIIVVCIVAFGALGALIFLSPAQKTYVVLREIPVATYYLKTNTIVTTLSKTVLTSSALLSAVTRTSFVMTLTSTQFSQLVISSTATVTSSTVVTVTGTGNTTVTSVQSLTFGFPWVTLTTATATVTYFVPTSVTETTTRWTSFNQTSTLTTTLTTTETSSSTYTRTVWTTLTSLPAGLSIYAPPAKSQTESLAPLLFCFMFLAGILILRKNTASSQKNHP